MVTPQTNKPYKALYTDHRSKLLNSRDNRQKNILTRKGNVADRKQNIYESPHLCRMYKHLRKCIRQKTKIFMKVLTCAECTNT